MVSPTLMLKKQRQFFRSIRKMLTHFTFHTFQNLQFISFFSSRTRHSHNRDNIHRHCHRNYPSSFGRMDPESPTPCFSSFCHSRILVRIPPHRACKLICILGCNPDPVTLTRHFYLEKNPALKDASQSCL